MIIPVRGGAGNRSGDKGRWRRRLSSRYSRRATAALRAWRIMATLSRWRICIRRCSRSGCSRSSVRKRRLYLRGADVAGRGGVPRLGFRQAALPFRLSRFLRSSASSERPPLISRSAMFPTLVFLTYTFTTAPVSTFLPQLAKLRNLGNPGLYYTANSITQMLALLLSGLVADRLGRGIGNRARPAGGRRGDVHADDGGQCGHVRLIGSPERK